MLYWVLKWIVIGPWLRVLYRPWTENLDVIPVQGPAILVSNHLSFSDSFFLPLVVDRKITFLAKQEYFTGKGIKGLISRAFFTGVGQVPIDRSSGRAAEAAIITGLRVLDEGHLLGIYPEGTRTADGRLYRGKTGVARMALESRVPVIPVAMIGTYEIQPPGRVRPNIRRVGIRFGQPLDFSRYEGLEGDRFVLRSVTDEIMYALMELSDQEYVDVYASRAKELRAERAAVAAGQDDD
ncbi:MAG: 1-acyl-sn-glycerol-3-phosphate acyltransferase [Actinomycetales bacterium mxb001]|nr:MAG: 1-acyl-sn-glycerol-3-phosphate acyltransferase [Actinomycetales bacterium mxb001]